MTGLPRMPRARTLLRAAVAVAVAAGVVLGSVSVLPGAPAESAPAPAGVLRPDPVIAAVPDAARPLLVVPAAEPVRERVVIALHGYTGGPQQLRDLLDADAWAGELDATVVYPEGLGRRSSWNAGGCCGSAARSDIDDVGFLARTIIRLRAEGAREVAVVGYSNGGMLAYRLACERPDLVDAVAVVNGTITTASCEGAFDALHLAGELDRAVPVQGADLVPYLFTGFRPLADLPSVARHARIDVRVLPGVGHEIDPAVHGIVTEWLAERIGSGDRHRG